MLELYEWADVLVLPSIVEGSAIVTYEALACGIPVIVTPNAGAWITHDVEGLVVPVRNSDALAAAIERFARDRSFLASCSANALAARDRIGSDAYGRRLMRILADRLKNARCG
jgi:glycosyltransferase involved in cell wall biosynthesis